jgi:hypothetical protein
MQHIEERDEVLAGDRPDGAPLAPSQLLAGDGVQEDLVVLHLIPPAGRRIDARLQEDREGGARLGGHRDEGHPGAWITRLDPPGEFQGGQRRPLARGRREMRVEQVVQLVVPGDDRPGQAGDDQERRDGESGPAVEEKEDGAHGPLRN